MSKIRNSKVSTVSFNGIEAFETTVECNLLPGIPSFTIVGLGDKTISESKERVKSAIFSSGFQFPNTKIIINLSPASIFKEGSHYDLPIAIAILVAIGEIKQEHINNAILMGELSLSGDIIPINGFLPATIFAKKNNFNFFGSKHNSNEIILPINYILENSLIDLKNSIASQEFQTYEQKDIVKEEKNNIFDTIYGHFIAKRALIIAAAGKHNIKFIGAKGVGKSLLSRSIIDLLPDLQEKESLESTSIHSIGGFLKEKHLLKTPPFRSPHSSCSLVSLVGGGTIPKPGEISLAHNGVLFLDELPEFSQMCIDSLRTPLEEHEVCLSRAKYKIVYPADFQLVVSMNPCKCGNLFNGNCSCKNKHYMSKVSGPIDDRIDMKIILDKPQFGEVQEELLLKNIKPKIIKARELQLQRFNNYNSRISLMELEQNGKFLDGVKEKIKNYCIEKELSMRGYLKGLSIARTIADLEQKEYVDINHITEAIFYIK